MTAVILEIQVSFADREFDRRIAGIRFISHRDKTK
jgi:hypothetical protein